jgi:hypothetical protein
MDAPVPVLRRFRSAGIGLLGTGVALVVHITSGLSLRIALALTTTICGGALWAMWARAPVQDRRRLTARLRIGFVAAAAATVAYDAAKFGLSQLDSSPYNPFEAIRVFGTLLVGSSASAPAAYAAGTAFHAINGLCFGAAFCMLVRHPGPWSGLLWGLFLEAFQLALYPGWLDIRAYREFAQISALSHVAYGVVLGTVCRRAGMQSQ